MCPLANLTRRVVVQVEPRTNGLNNILWIQLLSIHFQNHWQILLEPEYCKYANTWCSNFDFVAEVFCGDKGCKLYPLQHFEIKICKICRGCQIIWTRMLAMLKCLNKRNRSACNFTICLLVCYLCRTNHFDKNSYIIIFSIFISSELNRNSKEFCKSGADLHLGFI